MPDDVKTTRPRQEKASPGDEAPSCAALLDDGRHAIACWLQAMVIISEEITRFTQNRLQENMAAWSTLARCRATDEAVECQRRFVATAMQQYRGEIAKLSQMMVTIANTGPFSPPQS